MARWVHEREIKTLGWIMAVSGMAYIVNALTVSSFLISFISVTVGTVAGYKFLVIPRDVKRGSEEG